MRFGFGALCLCLLQGCVTLEALVPGALVEPPEVIGKDKALSLTLGADEGIHYTHSEDASRRPPTLTAPSTANGRYFYGQLGYGVQDWFELKARLLPGELRTLFIGGIGLIAKAQVLGVGEGPGAKVALFAAYMGTTDSPSGDQNGRFGNGGHNWKASAWGQTLTAGASAGYRFAEPVILVYVGAGYADQQAGGWIQHEASDNGLSPAAYYALDHVKGSSTSAALGFTLGEKVQLAVEGRAIRHSWPQFGGTGASGGGSTSETTVTAAVVIR